MPDRLSEAPCPRCGQPTQAPGPCTACTGGGRAVLDLAEFSVGRGHSEHRKLRLAVSRAAEGTDGAAITWVTLYGHQAAIVPADMAEYALRHGWGR